MKEQNIAKVYAQSFISLSQDSGFDVAGELTKLTEAINSSNNLENVLFLDVFTVEDKEAVFTAIAEKLSLHKVLVSAINYLISEKRINLLPLIYKEIMVIDDHNKGFLRGVVEGSEDSIDQEDEKKLKELIKQKMGVEPNLTYKKSDNITAGYKVTVEDMQLDASVDNQLYELKKSVLGEHI